MYKNILSLRRRISIKKLIYSLAIISLTFLLVSCSEDTEKKKTTPVEAYENPVVFKHKNQEFKIYNYYREFEEFLERTNKQPEKKEDLYRQTVVEEFILHHGYNYIEYWMLATPSNTVTFKKSLDSLIQKQELINDLIVDALKESADQLPGGNKSVYLLPAIPEFNSELKKMNYVTAEVWDENIMLVLIDPLFFEENLKYTIAHEYHHLVALEKSNPHTLLDRSVLEGKADIFGKMLYPEVNVPWIEPLTGYSEEQAWKIFKANLESTDTVLWFEFSQGNHYKGLEEWSNYKIGYSIMTSYLDQNPDVTISEWTQMSAREILLKSKLMAGEE